MQAWLADTPIMKSGTLTIVGRPNSGKSTLLNVLVGQKVSIVSSKPQTTRHRIVAILTEERGQAVFLDTPGIHKPKYKMNRRMLRSVMESLDNRDLILHILDASVPFGSGESYALEMIRKVGPKAFLLLNKIDRIYKPDLLPLMERCSREYDFLEIIPISARTQENLDVLLDKIFEYLPEGEPLFDGELITDRTERFLTAEFIREKILDRTREEIPYATAVMIRKFDESKRDAKNLVVIEADIIVEKKSQQGIILGAGGVQIRNLGIAARKSLEELLDCKVYLGLTVRTSQKWRDNDRVLDELELG
jgi:GTP-binding protein Era